MKKISWLALCALLGAAVLTGCGAGESEPFEEKTYTAQAEQVREVRLDVRDRSIEVSASEDGQIHIGCAENSKEYYEIGVSEDGVLEMTAASDKSWTDYIGGKAAAGSRKITLRLPQAQLSALALSTTNENVTFSNFSARRITVSVNGGDIQFDCLDVEEKLDLQVKNGGISGMAAGSQSDYAVTCAVKKGESTLPAEADGGPKQLAVSANNGDVNIRFAG